MKLALGAFVACAGIGAGLACGVMTWTSGGLLFEDAASPRQEASVETLMVFEWDEDNDCWHDLADDRHRGDRGISETDQALGLEEGE